MKLTKFANLVVLGLVLTIAVAGCRKRPGYITNIPGSGKTKVGDIGTGNPLEGSGTNNPNLNPIEGHPLNPRGAHEGWIEDASQFASDTVYFDFDSSVVKAAEKPKVASVATYLKSNPGHAVRVDGHCDERGTEEYNRALGERRALALREELIKLGIDPKDVDTQSLGKDRPKVQGHDENAWRQNRRGEFILLSPPK